MRDMLKANACTLFEGRYHFGVASLVNSLYLSGFRGVVWAGYRGSLPPWAYPLQRRDEYDAYEVAEDCSIHFIRVDASTHLTYHKPAFMRRILDEWDTVPALAYFDPDIVVKVRWTFFLEWIWRGVALVQEGTNASMPVDHPFRFAWRDYATTLGLPIRRSSAQLFNGGFLGVTRERRSFCQLWERLIESLPTMGIALDSMTVGDSTHPFAVPDQVCLNIASMLTDEPLSTVGPEEMDFHPGGSYMSHAVGQPKPWSKSFLLSALLGRPPSRAEKEFWRFTSGPIKQFPGWKRWAHLLDLKLGAGIGRIVRRGG
jgi:hypothetical protein